MDDAQVESLVHEIKRVGFRSVVFGGGEPLLWKGDLQRACDLAKEEGLMVQLCTNGTKKERLASLLAVLDRVILPLESSVEATHDRLRTAIHPHFRNVMELLRDFSLRGVETTISTVVNAQNIQGLPALAAHLVALETSGLRLHAWHLYRFLAIGRGGRVGADELQTPSSAYWAATNEVLNHAGRFAVYRRPHMLKSRCVEYFWLQDDCIHLGSDTF